MVITLDNLERKGNFHFNCCAFVGAWLLNVAPLP